MPGLRLLPDERLARLAARGDRAAFEVIFARYHQELYRYCVTLLHHRDDAADAVQSTMLQALRALEGETRPIALRPWLYRIAHNEAVNLMRRRVPSAPAEESPATVAADVESSAAARAQLDELFRDLHQLPERQRGALVMRELAGLHYDEIASAFAVSPEAAKQSVYEARRALYELAKGRGMDCDLVRRTLSDGDGRALRGRALRAHLADCGGCREFHELNTARRSALATLVPTLPVAAATELLHGVVGAGGSSAGGAAGGGMASGLSGMAGAKSVAAVAAALAVGAGVADLATHSAEGSGAVPAAPAHVVPASAKAPAHQAGHREHAHVRGHAAGHSSHARGHGRTAPASGATSGAATHRSAASAGGGASVGTRTTTPTPAATTQTQPRHLRGVRPVSQVRDELSPVRDQVRGVVDTVQTTTGSVTGNLPVKPPPLPGRPKRQG